MLECAIRSGMDIHIVRGDFAFVWKWPYPPFPFSILAHVDGIVNPSGVSLRFNGLDGFRNGCWCQPFLNH